MNASAPQSLANIDIAKPCHHFLIEQKQFDRLLAQLSGGAQMGSAQPFSQGFGAKASKGWPIFECILIHQIDRAKAAWIV